MCAHWTRARKGLENLVGDAVRVHYDGKHAHVQIRDRTLEVDRRDDAERTYTCPIELVTAALGS
jgi:hypothetical protein